MKIANIVGARPQFVKAAVVSRALRFIGVDEWLIHTGQHYDDNMSAVFFSELQIPEPRYKLGIGSGPHGKQTSQMLEAIERVLMAEQPDRVVVYGDTNSTLAGAIAAVKLQIPIAHVEAGLRSWNRCMPEEINRVLTDHAADLLFAPTQTAVDNLRREGIAEHKISIVGDVMYDAAIQYGSVAESRSDILNRYGLRSGHYILGTIHRAENTDSAPRLEAILTGLARFCDSLPVIVPLHPRTRKVLSQRTDFERTVASVHLIDPVGYLDMLMLEKHARLIATDSGGVQKEAFFQHVPCVTLRDETEWTELVDLGWNRLAPPTSPDVVSKAVQEALSHRPPVVPSPYGDGDSSVRIARILTEQTAVAVCA